MQKEGRISATLGGRLRLAVASTLVWIPLAMGGSAQAWAQTSEQQAVAEQAAGAGAVLVVPQQVRYAGKLTARAGETVEAVFRIYAAQEGGEPLWTETQQVPVSLDGSYTVLLGSASQSGLPQAVFSGGAARWLAVSVDRGPEPERVLLASVPYAMKSADAEALAGHAAADFVTQEQLAALTSPTSQSAASAQSGQAGSPALGSPINGNGPLTGSGTLNTVPLWTGANTQGNSLITQSGSYTGVNLNGVTPIAAMDVGGNFNVRGFMYLPPVAAATTAAGSRSQNFQFSSSEWSTTANASVNSNFKFGAFPDNNNTANPSAELDILYYYGTGGTTSILSIASTGVIKFAPTQTFPGTIKSVAATSPVTAATSSGAVTVGLNETTLTSDIAPGVATAITPTLETTFNTVYPQLATSNAFTSGASFAGPIFATALGSGATAVTATGTSGAYGVSASSDTGNAGTFGNASAPDATLYSANTASFNGSYIPVALNSTATGTSSIGAYGDGTLAGLTGASSSGIGVWGVSGSISSLPTLTTTGILGDASAPAFGNAGVLAFTGSSQSSSYTYEVGRFGIAGVWGDTTGNPTSATDFSAAVMGTTDALDGYGGAFIANSTATDALFAKNLSSGAGIYGESLGAGVTSGMGTGGTGVEGFTPSPAEGEAGVLGNAYQLSNTYSTVKALGPVGFVAGVWGDSGEVNDGTATYTAGVVGTGDDVTAAVFENNSGHPTISVTNLNSGGSTGLFRTLMASTPDGTCGFGGAGSLTCTGQMKSLATTADARKVETYSMQSPENWMEDFGTGELKLGVAVVKIDTAFADTVTGDAGYHVFITPNGDSEGLYVINKTATSFEVRESKGGTSSLTFDYRIVAKRRGYEAQRLTDVTERFRAEQARATPAAGVHPQNSPGPPRTSPGGPAASVARSPQRETPGMAQGAVKIGAGRSKPSNKP